MLQSAKIKTDMSSSSTSSTANIRQKQTQAVSNNKTNIPRRKPTTSKSKSIARSKPTTTITNTTPKATKTTTAPSHHNTKDNKLTRSKSKPTSPTTPIHQHQQSPTATSTTSPVSMSRTFHHQRQHQSHSHAQSSSRRRSSGPLSEKTMSQIKCPTRVDFLNAFNGVAPSTAFGSALALARSRSRSTKTKQKDDTDTKQQQQQQQQQESPKAIRTPIVSLRTSRLTDEENKSMKNANVGGDAKNNNASSSSCSTPVPSPNSINNTDIGTDRKNLTVASPTISSSSSLSQHPIHETDYLNENNDRSGFSPFEDEEKMSLDQTTIAANACVDDELEEQAPSETEEDEDDVGVPAYLNKLVLDAMDKISECDELRAIVTWMDMIRSRMGYTSAITDIDLSNGIALLQTLLAVAPESFENLSTPDLAVVRTHLDEDGQAAAENISNVISALYRFPWRDGVNGSPLHAVPFERVDIWGLAGFVVLAAVTGVRADSEVDRMLQMDEWVQDRLSDVVHSGLEALGGNQDDDRNILDEHENRLHNHHSNRIDNDGSDSELIIASEKRKREDLENEVVDLMKLVEELQCERDEVYLQLEKEKKESEQVKTELRRLRTAIGRKKKRNVVLSPHSSTDVNMSTSSSHQSSHNGNADSYDDVDLDRQAGSSSRGIEVTDRVFLRRSSNEHTTERRHQQTVKQQHNGGRRRKN